MRWAAATTPRPRENQFGQTLQEHAKEVNRVVLPPGVHDEVFIGAVENGKTMRESQHEVPRSEGPASVGFSGKRSSWQGAGSS